MKVTLANGEEYYELESPANMCITQDIRCACFPEEDAFCTTAPCREPPVIFLTKEMHLKRITNRLSQ